ncbi:peptidoglycan-binding protein, partial [Streptomyces katrae]|uniref:peptidoglycan-binding protein n=1 Tax=Streptomyces katrae TaxID=68223 RepID=UPI000AEAAF4A
RYPDGQCPPTADPDDPRGGPAVTGWRWAPPAGAFEPFPGAGFFTAGRRSPVIAALHDRLVAVDCDRYESSADADVWGPGDVRSYRAWQRTLGYHGPDADGIPGSTSWARLQVPRVEG